LFIILSSWKFIKKIAGIYVCNLLWVYLSLFIITFILSLSNDFYLKIFNWTNSSIYSCGWDGLNLLIFILPDIFYFYWILILFLISFNRRESILFFFYIPFNTLKWFFNFFELLLDPLFFILLHIYLCYLLSFYLGVWDLTGYKDAWYLSLFCFNFLNVLHFWICKWSSISILFC
jgi:hypothetical protein